MLQYLALHFQDLISCVSVVRDEAELFNAWRIDFLILPLNKVSRNNKTSLLDPLPFRTSITVLIYWLISNLRGNEHTSDAEQLKSLSFYVVPI